MVAPLAEPAMSSRGNLHSFFKDVATSKRSQAHETTEHGSIPSSNNAPADTPRSSLHGPITIPPNSTHDEPSVPAPPNSHATQPVEACKPPPAQSRQSAVAWPISSKAFEPEKKRRKIQHEAGKEEEMQVQPEQRASIKNTGGDTAEQIVPIEGKDDCHATKTGDDTAVNENDRVKRASSPTPVSPPRQSLPEPPKKMLKLNASGTLGSPKASNVRIIQKPADALKPRKRGRPRKSLIVICRYQGDRGLEEATIGQRIQSILAGTETYSLPSRTDIQQPPTPIGIDQPAKNPHPFFSGPRKKAGPVADVPAPVQQSSPERKSFASTPGKIRQQVQQMKAARLQSSPMKAPAKANPRGTVSKGDPWPAPGTLHIRGLPQSPSAARLSSPWPLRKNKVAALPTSDTNFWACHSAAIDMVSDGGRRLREDGFSEPHPSLRLPSKSFLTGTEILQLVTPQLSGERPSAPAITQLIRSVTTSMTSYDHGRGEAQPWTSKYAPSNAATVLQSGSEAEVLRDWMKMLTVTAVSGSLAPTSKSQADAKPRKKRRKRAADLDDFIVGSDDDADSLGALSGLEEMGSQDSRAENTRSLVRNLQGGGIGDAPKIANTVVISGPHGCGKTAMVFAVAKELGFQVFEINAGSRRSGKDVLERIGDVIGNHIVSHNKADGGNLSADEDSKKVAAAFQKDLESGRQGTMNSFFRSASVKQPPGPKKVQKHSANDTRLLKPPKAEPNRNQKQSIILLEEVDVLFEEDRSFWTTVMSLISISRRPIVMTCTDECALPGDGLNPHAILRLTSPSVDMAADYLLLVAAQEGHILSRESVKALYEQKRHDLRASILDLQFWCQMGIGDPRGGLGWIFQRWPPGIGEDAHGNVQRVVSQGTYQPYMGCLPCEREALPPGQEEEELMSEAYMSWALDPRDDCHFQLADIISVHSQPSANTDQPINSLRQMARLTETLSALDVQCRSVLTPGGGSHSRHSALGSSLQQPLISTAPELPAKARHNYTDYPSLIQADEAEEPTQFCKQLMIAACSLLPPATGVTSRHGKAGLLQQLIRQKQPYAGAHSVSAMEIYGALEPLADPPQTSSQPLYSGNYTSLVSPLSLLTTDVAPYARSISAHDTEREEQRRNLYDALHGDVTQGKMRRTRAARGALEGKGRGGVRREQWWECTLDLACTAGEHMLGAGKRWAEQAASLSVHEDEDMNMSEGG